MPNLVAAAIRQGIYTNLVGKRILYYPELGSTMDEAARLADEGAEDGTVVVAETQTAGRGRHGREWVSQPGNLLFSVLFRPEVSQLPFVTLIGGLAAARAVRKVAGLDARIKWPNDLTIGGRKAAGVLAESAIAGDRVCYAVLGIGMNVALDAESSAELAAFATSIDAAAGGKVSRESLFRQLLIDLDAAYLQLQRGWSPVPEWTELVETIGQRIHAVSGNDTYSGLAEGVDAWGNLVLRQNDGSSVTLTAGDVTLRS